MASPIPHKNFVGELHETCIKLNLGRPEFDEGSEGTLSKLFKCSCKVGKWSAIGEGYTKQTAKHNAAKKVIDLIETENKQDKVEKGHNLPDKAVSMLAIYCVKHNIKVQPLYSEKPKDGDWFVIECSFQDFSATGKGKNKKIAKENAAESVANHFKVIEYFKNLAHSKERRQSTKNPITRVNELAQEKKLEISFTEKAITAQQFVCLCQMGGKSTESSVNTSKKNAKMEASSLMLDLFANNAQNTPPVSEGGYASDCVEASNSDKEESTPSLTEEVYVSSEEEKPVIVGKKRPQRRTKSDGPLSKKTSLSL